MKLLIFFILVSLLATSAVARISENKDVLIYAGKGSRNLRCVLSNEVIGPARLKKFLLDEKCRLFSTAEDLDFERYSIVTYKMRGDCKISGSAKVTLDRKYRLYTVHLTNQRGSCRAGGSYSGWLQIEKIAPGFGVEFEENTVEGPLQQLLPLHPGAQKHVPAEETNLKGCVWLDSRKTKYIASETEYLDSIRKDAQTDSCKAYLKELDFPEYSYIGVSISSGYCGRPPDLSHSVIDYGGSRNFLVHILYTPPSGTCRALSKYDLWIRVPQTKEKYNPVIRINRITIN